MSAGTGSNAGAAAPSMRATVLGGLGWKLASQLVVQGSRVGVAIVLARLLAPHDYGLAGMALVFGGLALVFGDFALGTALVQRKHLTELDRSTVFWTTLGTGVAGAALLTVLARPIAGFYGEPRVEPFLIAIAAGFVLTSLSSTQSALLCRALNFRALELTTSAATIGGAAVGIAAAAEGYGAWALIAQRLGYAVLALPLLWWFSGWRPSFCYSVRSLRDLGRFGGNLLGSRILFYLHRNVDNLLVGRFLGASSLGAYSIGYNLILAPFTGIVDPIRAVLMPVLSRVQDDLRQVGAVWLGATRVIAAAFAPAMLGLIVVAPDLLPLLLGPQWHAAVPVVQILAGVGLLQSLAALNSVVLPVLDRTATLFRFSIVTAILSIGGFVAGLHWGVVGVSAGFLAANVIVVPLYLQLTARALGLKLGEVARSLAVVAELSAAVVIVAVVSRSALVRADVGTGVRLVVVVAAGTVVFAALSSWRLPELRAELARLRGRSRPQLAASPLES